jgi:hypothetical protein
MNQLCSLLLNPDVVPLVRIVDPAHRIRLISRLGRSNAEFVDGMMKADNRHRERFAGTIASGNDSCEIPWPESVICSVSAGLPPSDLSCVAFDTEPARSKELDVTATASQIESGLSLDRLQDSFFFLFLRRSLILEAFALASALLLAPHA